MLTIFGNIVAPDHLAPNSYLTINDSGQIGDLSAKRSVSPWSEDIDATGYLVLPGFIDMHIHGGGGADFMHGTAEAVRQVTRTHARFGTTALLATTLTASREATDNAIVAVRDVLEQKRGLDEARILGIHLEGPYICAARRGAQPEAYVREPDAEELAHWIALSHGNVRQITLAPERPGAEAAIRVACDAKVVVSIGHTNATADEIEAAVGWGATQATHTFNAMRGLHHREPGTVGAVLTNSQIIAEVIADGVHLHPMIVKLIVDAKGPTGIVLSTDAIEGAAMPGGEYSLGGKSVFVANGTAAFADGTLAGSVLTMNQAFWNMRHFAGVSETDAAQMSSANAARQIGVSNTLGKLAPGCEADIVIVDPQTGEVAWTIIGGEVAYHR